MNTCVYIRMYIYAATFCTVAIYLYTCVFVYMFNIYIIYIFLYVGRHYSPHGNTYTYKCTYIFNIHIPYVHMYMYICICIGIYTCICRHIYMYMHMYTCKYTYVCIRPLPFAPWHHGRQSKTSTGLSPPSLRCAHLRSRLGPVWLPAVRGCA